MNLQRFFAGALCALLLACSSADGSSGAEPPGTPWNDPDTWGGTPPTPDSEVTIPAGKKVTLDSDVCVKTLTIEGVLEFADKDLNLCAEWIMVHGSGRLVVGSKDKPYRRKATITLLDGDRSVNVMDMGSKFLGAMAGGTIEMHGETGFSPWTKLAGPVEAGATTIAVVDATGWKVGDSIVIATGSSNPDDAEVFEVTGINGNQLTLNQGLKHARPGKLETIDGRSVDMRAAVGRLTRNILITGDPKTTDNFGGHVMVMEGGSAYIDGVEFQRMGQFDHLGRYPFHWHIVGDISGQYIKNSVVNRSFQRGIVVHSSQNGLVEGNIVFDVVGHSYLVETPVTTDNTFKNNLAVVNHIAHFSEPMLATQGDNQAANFWITAARNTFIANEAAGSDGNGFWYDNTTDYPTVFEDNVAYAAASRSTDVDFVRESGLLVVVAADVTLEFGKTVLFNNNSALWPTEQGHQVYKDFVFANNAVTVETTGNGRATFESPLFYRSGILIQYGGTVDLNAPTFVEMLGGVYSTNDIFVPWMADYRVKGAKFVGGQGPWSPGVPDHAVVEALDDTFLPKGFYVPAGFPHLATASMTLKPLGTEDESVAYFSPTRLAYANLRVLTSPDGFASRGSTVDGFASSMLRSDGLAFEPVDGAAQVIGNDTSLSYRFLEGPSGSRFATVLDLHGGIFQAQGPLSVEVAIPTSAPTQVRWSSVGDNFGPNLEEDPTTAMSGAASLSAFRADENAYYFDAGNQRLHIRARSDRYVIVDR
jgi:hypothetical protein